MTISCNSKGFERVRQGRNKGATYSHRVWEVRRERPRLSTRGCTHCFGLAIVEFKFVHSHPGFNVISILLHGEEKLWNLMWECRFLELRVIGV